MNHVKNRCVWALQSSKGGLIFASGNWLAPAIYRNRELARTAQREFMEYHIKVKIVRIVMNATFEVLP